MTAPSIQGVAGKLSTSEMIAVVNNGGGGMPAFSAKLSAEEIAAVVAYARGL